MIVRIKPITDNSNPIMKVAIENHQRLPVFKNAVVTLYEFAHNCFWVYMGFTHVKIKVCSPIEPSRFKEVELLADTGAVYMIIPRRILEDIGIKPLGRRRFKLADGRLIERDVGVAITEYETYVAGATTTFGEEGAEPVFGIQALEGLGLEVDPVTKQFKPAALLLV
jgi:clan AA aspartic protease